MTDQVTGLPFDDIRALLKQLPGPDQAACRMVAEREGVLTKPAGSLGRLEDLTHWAAGWQAKAPPGADRIFTVVFASAHGVTDQGVSAFPAAVNMQMVENFTTGGAAINQICKAHDIGLKVFELAVHMPTPDISLTDAMTEAECAATVAYGMEAIHGDIDFLCLGEMGIGNTTVAAAIYHALFGGSAADWTGAGTGVEGDALQQKIAVVERCVARLEGETDPLEILRRVGGREIAAMVGAILAARIQRVPVIVDGFVTTAAAAVVEALYPGGTDHCLYSHCSAESGHRRVLEKLGKKPLFDFNLRLGEGTGAALAAVIVKTAIATHTGMATFEEAGVSEKSE